MVKSYALKQAQKDLPCRKSKDHKLSGGKCLVVAGSSKYPGACQLTAEACFRSGAGYVYVWPGSKKIKLSPELIPITRVADITKQNIMNVALGPGVTDNKLVARLINYLKKNQIQNVVLDAGALSFLVKKPQKLPSTWIITPHEGELAKLLGTSSKRVRQNRLQSLKLAQKKFNCIVLLKGSGTLVGAKESKVTYKIQSGNASLSKAGTGDVLTGIILAFLSQGLNPLQAASLGAFIHGWMADRYLAEGNDILSLVASDLLKRLPKDLEKLRNI